MHHTVPSPGDFIRDELKKRSWSQEDLAQILSRTTSRISELLKGKQEVSPEIALELEKALGPPATVWMQREAEYRLAIMKPEPDDVRKKASLYELAPIRDIEKRGWIKKTASAEELESELTRFFGVDDLSEEPTATAAMRKTNPDLVLTPAQKAWVARVRQLANSTAVAPFDESRLTNCQRELKKLVAYSAEVRKVPQILANHGIRFVVVEPLAGGKADGVATWLNATSPVIGMSLRYDRIDSFWFTLGHELSHIIHHDVAPLDVNVGNSEEASDVTLTDMETRANAESASLLINQDELRSFILRVGPLYSKDRINQFANRIKVHPGVIVGQLQHLKEIGFFANKEMLVKIRHVIVPVAITDGWGKSSTRGL